MNRKHCWLCGAPFASSKDELDPELCTACALAAAGAVTDQDLVDKSAKFVQGEMNRRLFQILEWHMAKFHRNQAMVNDIVKAMPVLARLQQRLERLGR